LDRESRLLDLRLRLTAGLVIVLVGLQAWWSWWPRPLPAGGRYLVTRPAGAAALLKDAADIKNRTPTPLGKTPVPLPNNLVFREISLRLPGYREEKVSGRALEFVKTPSGALVATIPLEPNLPLLIPGLYLARDHWLLLLAGLAAAAFLRLGWLPYRRLLERQNHLRKLLAQGAIAEGLRLGSVELGQPLGRGGMGAVFCARKWDEPGQEWPLAVKLLTAEATLENRQRFLREADVCRRLDHPNIVRLLDWGEEVGQLYLVLERVEGASLEGRRPRDLAQLLDWARQLAGALAYAHERGLVHRDIKPSNLMLTVTGRLVVMDFGIASRTDLTRLTLEGDALGTPGYMALEQLRGEVVDYRTDLYAFGVVLYEWLAGRRPYEGATLMDLLGRQVHGQYEPLGGLAPEAPPALLALVERLLVPFPEQRASEPGQILQELLML